MIWYGNIPSTTCISDPIPTMSTQPDSQDRSFSEFFAGIGLMRMGLERAGWNIVFANDISPEKREMYETNFGSSAESFLLHDIHTIPVEDVPDSTLATASFPCTDLSLAGARKGLGGRQSSAFWGFIEILNKMGPRRPPMVLLENVTGFLTSNNGEDFESAMLALNKLGYLVDAIIVDAAAFVPQSRLRLFVIGCQQGFVNPDEIREDVGFWESETRPRALADFILTHPNIGWMLRELPALPKRTIELPDILEDLPADSDYWWSGKRRDYLINQMSDRHGQSLSAMKNREEWSYGTVFRRVRNGRSMAELRTDGVAGCLRTPKGGSARQILVKAGFGKVHVRLLTPRECARLMGADYFRIEVPLNQALFGFGDAVCVPVVEWIAHNHLNPLRCELLKNQTFSLNAANKFCNGVER